MSEDELTRLAREASSSEVIIYCQTCGRFFYRGAWQEIGAGPTPRWFLEAAKHDIGKNHIVLLRGLPGLPDTEVPLRKWMMQATGKSLEEIKEAYEKEFGEELGAWNRL